MNKVSRIGKVGLLTPYNGGNLGDGAVLDAVIQNIRKRLSKAEICAFTTYPEMTARLHNIPCFPMTGIQIPGYSTAPSNNHLDPPAVSNGISRSFKTVKRKLRQSSCLYFPLKIVYVLLKGVFKGIPMLFAELCHIARSYRLMKKIDLLIVSGGGQLDDYWGGPMGHPYSLFKWALIAKTTGTRFVFLSVGLCSVKSILGHFFIKNALKLAEYRSYRDGTSKGLLRNISFTQKDQVYPDLSLSYSLSKHQLCSKKADRRDKRAVVGISPIAYLSQYDWPKTNLTIFEKYLNQLVAFTSELVQRNYEILIFSTDSPDRHVVKDIISRLRDHSGYEPDGLAGMGSFLTVKDLFEHLKTVDYVVASRLHGIILSHYLEIPALAISYDRKVNTYMKEADQRQYCLDIHDIELERLLEKFDRLVSNKDEIKTHIKIITENSRMLLQKQYNQIFM